MNTIQKKLTASEIIEQNKIGKFQYMVFALCWLVAFIEGFDTQSVGFVAPSLAKEFELTSSVLGMFFSTGLVGLMLGAVGLAPLADRFGRKPLILFGTLVFGLGSLGVVFVDSTAGLFFMRLITGVGIGAVMPNLIALTAEYSPVRKRAMIVMLMFSGFTFGSMTAGLVVVKLIASYGWSIVFLVGGVLPLLAWPFLWKFLPESMGWLASNAQRSNEALGLAQSINPAEQVNDVLPDEQVDESKATIAELFRDKQARKTVLLWTLFLMSLMNIYLLVSWLPKIVVELGFTIESAAFVGVMFQIGGLAALLPIGWLSDKWSACGALAIAYVIAAICVPSIGFFSTNMTFIVIAAFMAGFGVLGGQNAANALAAGLYPTKLRATAVGSALGVGRIGSIIGPLVAGLLLASGFQAENILAFCAVPALIAAVAAILLSRSGV